MLNCNKKLTDFLLERLSFEIAGLELETPMLSASQVLRLQAGAATHKPGLTYKSNRESDSDICK